MSNPRQYEHDPQGPDPEGPELRPLFRSWVLQLECLERLEDPVRSQLLQVQVRDFWNLLTEPQRQEVRGAVACWAGDPP